MQWGTPEDVSEYNKWSQVFRGSMSENGVLPAQGSHVVLLAGLGQRFVNEGYSVPKPLIQVSGRSMVAQAALDLPSSQHQAFVLRSDMPGQEALTAEIKQFQPAALIVNLPSLTEGQACSALLGLDRLAQALGEAPGPITFGSCDFGMLYDLNALRALLDDDNVDVIVWGARGYPNAARNPGMFGWIEEQAGRISRISVKSPLKAPETDAIVLGTFTFRRGDDFRRAVHRLMTREGRVNGEFYIDSCLNDAIALGLKCRLFEVESYLSWGTPNDLRTFEYWQSCFHKWPTHPYRLEQDPRIPNHALRELEFRYRETAPSLPALRK
jgi:choline kinase